MGVWPNDYSITKGWSIKWLRCTMILGGVQKEYHIRIQIQTSFSRMIIFFIWSSLGGWDICGQPLKLVFLYICFFCIFILLYFCILYFVFVLFAFFIFLYLYIFVPTYLFCTFKLDCQGWKASQKFSKIVMSIVYHGVVVFKDVKWRLLKCKFELLSISAFALKCVENHENKRH